MIRKCFHCQETHDSFIDVAADLVLCGNCHHPFADRIELPHGERLDFRIPAGLMVALLGHFFDPAMDVYAIAEMERFCASAISAALREVEEG